MSLNFAPNPAKDNSPVLVTITADGPGGNTSVPLICWLAETVLPGDLTITGIIADPPGPDLPGELVTIQNVSNLPLDLTGCTLEDEGFPGGLANRTTYRFPPGFTVAPGSSFKVHTGSGTDSASDLFMGRPKPIWNNDFDSAIVRNLAGDPVATFAYIFTAPGVRIPGQTKILDSIVFVDQALGSTFSGALLEDGDFVVIEPDPTSRSFSGDFAVPATGPGGATTNAPDDRTWPFAGAPKFVLLADAGVVTVVGASRLAEVINRTSMLRAGNPLNLLINDSAPGGFGAWGGYSVRVRQYRKV